MASPPRLVPGTPARRALRSAIAATIALLLGPLLATAEPRHPLEPPDRSSPRATLFGFIEEVDAAYTALQEFRQQAREGKSLGDVEEIRQRARYHRDRALQCLDLREVPDEIVDDVGVEAILQLKETLDRLVLPRPAAVPDADAMESEGLTEWTVPHTEIGIGRVEEGPDAGLYLFTAETVDRAGEFYQRVKDLPYRRGASKGIYEFYIYTPGGLIPVAVYWSERLPEWARVAYRGQALWQWVGLVLVVFLGIAAMALVLRLTRGRREDASELRMRWKRLLRPIAAMLIVRGVAFATDSLVNITGDVLTFSLLGLGALFYAALVGTVWHLGGLLAETIISSQQLRVRSIDSQLIRLGLRLFTFMIAAAITVHGAQRLGLPAYSVLTGLGIGGLAFALAARESLANLLGSLVIMFERPIRVGDWVKTGDAEGTVEGVGFRSTRIRTFYNSLVSIPNSELVNSVLDNMGMRHYRRVRTFMRVTYDTPAAKLEQLTTEVRELILEHPTTWKGQCHVVVQNFAESGIEIMLYFFLQVPDWAAELVERQKILLKIMRRAEELGVRFAFPTRTLHLEGPAAEGAVPEADRSPLSSIGS